MVPFLRTYTANNRDWLHASQGVHGKKRAKANRKKAIPHDAITCALRNGIVSYFVEREWSGGRHGPQIQRIITLREGYRRVEVVSGVTSF